MLQSDTGCVIMTFTFSMWSSSQISSLQNRGNNRGKLLTGCFPSCLCPNKEGCIFVFSGSISAGPMLFSQGFREGNQEHSESKGTRPSTSLHCSGWHAWEGSSLRSASMIQIIREEQREGRTVILFLISMKFFLSFKDAEGYIVLYAKAF